MIDPTSQTWAHVKEWAEKELQSARLQVEAQGTDPIATEALRGKISTLKNLLSQTKDKPEIPSSGPGY